MTLVASFERARYQRRRGSVALIACTALVLVAIGFTATVSAGWVEGSKLTPTPMPAVCSEEPCFHIMAPVVTVVNEVTEIKSGPDSSDAVEPVVCTQEPCFHTMTPSTPSSADEMPIEYGHVDETKSDPSECEDPMCFSSPVEPTEPVPTKPVELDPKPTPIVCTQEPCFHTTNPDGSDGEESSTVDPKPDPKPAPSDPEVEPSLPTEPETPTTDPELETPTDPQPSDPTSPVVVNPPLCVADLTVAQNCTVALESLAALAARRAIAGHALSRSVTLANAEMFASIMAEAAVAQSVAREVCGAAPLECDATRKEFELGQLDAQLKKLLALLKSDERPSLSAAVVQQRIGALVTAITREVDAEVEYNLACDSIGIIAKTCPMVFDVSKKDATMMYSLAQAMLADYRMEDPASSRITSEAALATLQAFSRLLTDKVQVESLCRCVVMPPPTKDDPSSDPGVAVGEPNPSTPSDSSDEPKDEPKEDSPTDPGIALGEPNPSAPSDSNDEPKDDMPTIAVGESNPSALSDDDTTVKPTKPSGQTPTIAIGEPNPSAPDYNSPKPDGPGGVVAIVESAASSTVVASSGAALFASIVVLTLLALTRAV